MLPYCSEWPKLMQYRPRPLGSPSARVCACEAHPDHGEPQPSTNPTFLPPTHRKQNRAYCILNPTTNPLSTPILTIPYLQRNSPWSRGQARASPCGRTASQKRHRASRRTTKTVKWKNGFKALLACLTRAGMTSAPSFTTSSNIHPVAETTPNNFRRAASQRPMRHYEFPTGFNTYFGPERFQVGELFFAHSRELVVSSHCLPPGVSFSLILRQLCT